MGTTPEMLQLMMDRLRSCWKADALPHSGGSFPVKLLIPSCRDCSDGKEALPAQAAGRDPVSSVSSSRRASRDAKAPGLPQAAGTEPALTHTH